MTGSALVLSGFGATALTALVIVLAHFNLKRWHIIRAAAAATGDQLECIYQLVERVGTEQATGALLVRTNRTAADSTCLIPVPAYVPDFPWGGRCLRIESGPAVRFHFVDAGVTEPMLRSKFYRYLRIPRILRKNSKSHNVFLPERYLAENADLLAALAAVCPKYPRDLLSYLLCAGLDVFEFEPLNQARIATYPAWAQSPQYPTCNTCRAPMILILQVPGTLIRANDLGIHYLLGCRAHPDQTETVTQFT